MTVHSAKGGFGKSILVLNLAVALARKGKSVGVIYLDYAALGLHIIFGSSKEQVCLRLVAGLIEGTYGLKVVIVSYSYDAES